MGGETLRVGVVTVRPRPWPMVIVAAVLSVAGCAGGGAHRSAADAASCPRDERTARYTAAEQVQLRRDLLTTHKDAAPGSSGAERSAASLDRRSGEGDALGRLVVPKLDLDFVMVKGASPRSLRRGLGVYSRTLPGSLGTVDVAGYRKVYGAPFRQIDTLRRGDAVVAVMPYGTLRYRVDDVRVVSPTDLSALRHGRQALVLSALHPLCSQAERIVVSARQVR